jgi:hypothetical protein
MRMDFSRGMLPAFENARRHTMDVLTKTFTADAQEPQTSLRPAYAASEYRARPASNRASEACPAAAQQAHATAGQAELCLQAANALTAILAHAEAIRRFAANLKGQHEDVAFSTLHIAAEAKRAWSTIAALTELEARNRQPARQSV